MKWNLSLAVVAALLLGACASTGSGFAYQNYPAGGQYRTFTVSPSSGPRHIANADNVLLPFFVEEMKARGYEPADHDADLDVTYEVRVYIHRQINQTPVAGADSVKFRTTLSEDQKGAIAVAVTDARTGAVVYSASVKGDVPAEVTDEQLHAAVAGLLAHLPPAAKR